MGGALRIERDGLVLRVTLAKPERRNAFDAELIAELHAAFSDVGDARAVVLEGDGPSFCAGADVDWQRASVDLTYDENLEDAMRLYLMLQAIDRCAAPVVGRIHGYALGGGSGVAACLDVAIARDDSVFGFSEVRLGIVPAVISPFVLPRIGPGAARRYFLTGERFESASSTRSPPTSTRPSSRRSRTSSRADPRPFGQPSASSATRPVRPKSQSAPRACGPALRARRACARSSRSAPRRGDPEAPR